MRNLKRVLSLALASVMLLGMMVIGAGAADKTYADLTDSDQITNQEAVSLMVDLGIIEGKPDGSYAPSETVDRATMAKLITMMLMGNVDQSAFEGTKTDLTDIDTSWAEGYIKYCYANGIITGDGQGHFFPTEPVTVVQAAKMLLVAIGYDADDRGYQGDANWSTNIMRDAQTTMFYDTASATKYTTTLRSLTKGLDVKATDPLTRDNAAQMIFNALFVQNQKPNYQWDMGTQYIQSYTAQPSLAATMFNGLTKTVATLNSVSASGKIATATVTSGLDMDNDGSVSDEIPSGLTNLAASSVNVGKSITFYVNASNKVVSSSALVNATTGVEVPDNLTSGVVTKDGTALKFLKDNGLDATTTISAITVNQFSASGAVTTWATAQSSNTLDVALTNITKGDLVTLYDTDNDGVVEIINIISKSVAKVGSAPVVKTDASDGKEKVTISGLGISNVEVSKVNGYEGLAKDDIVLYYKDGEGNFYIEKAATVSGTVTGSKGTGATAQILLNGTYYGQSGLATCSVAGSSVSTYLSNGKFNVDAVAYLDNNGNIIAIDNVVESASNYGVILKTAWVVGQGVDAAANSLEAKILYADGTTETVVISKVNGDKVVKTGTTIDSEFAANGANTTSANSVKYYGVTDSSTTGNIDATVFKYLVNDGKVELTTVSGGKATSASATVTNGNPTVNGEVATNATIYVYHTKSNSKDVFTVYTGYAAAPTTTNTKVALAVDSNSRVPFVYVDATGSSATTGETSVNNYLYVLDTVVASRYENGKTYYEIKGVLNGDTATTTVVADSNTISNLFSSGNAVKGLFKVTLDDNGYVTGSTATAVTKSGNWVAVASTDKANGAPAGGVLAVDGTNAGTYTYDGSEKVYIVDETNGTMTEATMESIEAGDKLYVEVVNAGGTAAERVAVKTVYVVR
ncbi:S-layer homology domain-containing protein [Pseudoflavonifractor sp.]|jgi:hypothetical protein|uniref:S-layer homology domain-containing protein n=1 Tax=Pseudoflavonifractor sp. TaxID=1980281 RepID=UPI003D92CB67